MAGEIPIRALLGSLGVDGYDGQQVIQGTRIPFSVPASLAVPLSTTGVLNALFTVPAMSAVDALWVEHLGGIIFPSDASGKLTLQGVSAGIFDATSGGTLPLETIATLGPMPANAVATIGVFIQPPPPLRCRDILGGKPGDVLQLFLKASVQNTDGAAAHTFAITLAGFVRIISGVSP